MTGWLAELATAGYRPDVLLQSVQKASAQRRLDRPAELSARQIRALAAHALSPGQRLATEKVFTRAEVAVAVGPRLFGFRPRDLLRSVEAVCAPPRRPGAA
jgi:hypothetical protein